MKILKFKTLLLLLISTVYLQAQNTIYVNNNPNSLADYSSFQTAVDSANSGDIIMVYGSATSYGIDTIDKPLAIIGTGYFLSANPNTQVNPTSAKFDGLYIGAGADGTIITGLEITGTTVFGAAMKVEQATNIIISRNNMTTNNTSIEVLRLYNSSNIQIIQNYIDNNNSGGGWNYHHNAIVLGSSSGITVKNNFIEAVYRCLSVSSTSSAIFENNTFKSTNTSISGVNGVDVDNSTFNNNILINTHNKEGSNYSASNNICTNTTFDTTGSNQQNIAENSIFVGAGGNSPDGRWELSTNSPALGAGLNGVNCGIFGGAEPYVLSGIPFVPNIISINMPNSGTSGSGINVNIKIRANQ